MKYLILLSISILSLQFTHAQDHTCPPVNEVSKDPTLEKFVNDLKQVISQKDKSKLIYMLDHEVSGGLEGSGVKDFIENWNLDKDSTVMWAYMSRAIELGGAFSHDSLDKTGKYQFVFPYTYNLNLGPEGDYEDLAVITGKNVNLRKSPDAKSPVTGQLTYDVVWFVTDKDENFVTSGKNGQGDPEWYMIESYDKSHKGWVNWNYVYSLMGPRLFLYKNSKGKWGISAFLTGD